MIVAPGAGGIAQRAVLGGGEGSGRGGIGDGEIDDLLALFSDRQRIHDDVELAGIERRDHAVPIGGDQRAFDLGALAEHLGKLRLETAERAVGIGEVPRRISAFERNGRLRPVLGKGGGGKGGKSGNAAKQDGAKFH